VDVQFAQEDVPVGVVMVASGARNRVPLRGCIVDNLGGGGVTLNGRITEASAGDQREKK
jgi:hypothetical protein